MTILRNGNKTLLNLYYFGHASMYSVFQLSSPFPHVLMVYFVLFVGLISCVFTDKPERATE